ncbi:hypothetical protein C8F04DRAFT_327234 [Mycena alexandri]|uniref:Rho-GAP domain-containing protein n=1 Tax=Mycena alexandri TaxID=1745969 RepID=A0AAD6S211_9AGAR|nr:hypothetical protein C8F04DRAFT_327234 [Mycena alexandri]
MFFSRNSSLPPADPYTPLPKAPRGRATSNTHSRSVSTSFVPEPTIPTGKASKRHTYHVLQSTASVAWNRVVSLPSADETDARGRPTTRLRTLQNQTPTSGDRSPPLGHPRRLNNSDPRTLLRALNALLDPKSQRIPDCLDVDHLIALHERDSMEREQRDAIKIKARTDRASGTVVSSGLTVFGSSLREATMYASNGTVLGGCEHDLPIVIFRCVQELCRHGFRIHVQSKPDRNRLLFLISAFDTEPQFGATTQLNCPYDLPEVYALLTTYLFALPEPVLSSDMFEAIWAWCVLPSLRRTDFLDEDNRFRCHVPADAGIPIAQLLLRLLPLPNFSLIVYMMGFFERLPHMVTDDVGRAVFAGRPTKQPSHTDGRAERAETMLRWFLDRWDSIFKELFPSLEPQQTTVAWSPVQSPPTSVAPKLREDAECTPKVGPIGPSRVTPLRLPSEGLFEKAIGTESDASSVSSSCARECIYFIFQSTHICQRTVGERLLDVTLEDAQLDKKHWDRYGPFPDNASDDSGYQSPEEDHHAPPSPQPPEERELSYIQALRRISLLERELERSDVAVAEAISETFKAREQVKELEAKLRGYEQDAGKRPPVLELKLAQRAADDWHAVLQSDTEALKLQLAEAHKERDAALQLVDEIKRLMSGGRG